MAVEEIQYTLESIGKMPDVRPMNIYSDSIYVHRLLFEDYLACIDEEIITVTLGKGTDKEVVVTLGGPHFGNTNTIYAPDWLIQHFGNKHTTVTIFPYIDQIQTALLIELEPVDTSININDDTPQENRKMLSGYLIIQEGVTITAERDGYNCQFNVKKTEPGTIVKMCKNVHLTINKNTENTQLIDASTDIPTDTDVIEYPTSQLQQSEQTDEESTRLLRRETVRQSWLRKFGNR